jgi:hypothetical protein
LSLPNVSSLEISLISPQEVKINEEFTVSISADSTENYDVKIFVHNSEDEKIDRDEYISEIYNENWKDSYNYIKSSFPEKTEYKIRVLESPGDKEICARLRKTGASTFSTQCNAINVLQSENSVEEDSNEEIEEDEVNDKEDEEDEEDKLTEKDSEKEPSEEDEEPIKNDLSGPVQMPTEESKKISYPRAERLLLNPRIQKKNDLNEKITTPEGDKKDFLIYGFTGFCILIIILLALKKSSV